MKNKKFYIISILLALLFVSAVTVASYAYFVGSVNSGTINNTAVTTGNMELEFTDGPEVTLSNGLPGVYVEKTFSVKNVGTVETTYDVYFSDIVNTFVDKSDLVYTLTSNDGGYNLSTQTEMPSRVAKMVDTYPIGANETHTYTLRVDFLETNDNQDDNKGKKFKTVIRVNEFKTNESVLGFLDNQDYNETGEFVDTITANGVSYPVHVYNYVGNQTWTTETVPNGGIFGRAEDVGTASTNATRMVVVKVDGDLTIGSEVTIQPYYTQYGGPKGFTLYVTGKLTNNGTIDNSHGAYAKGEDVYLWKNSDGTYEYVPKLGGIGGVAPITSTLKNDGGNYLNGNKGANGTERSTGGGGSGSIRNFAVRMYAGAGGNGTSYSGGTGGGAAATDRATSRTAGSGSNYGGSGGHGAQGGAETGKSGGTTNGYGQAAGGGAGNGPGNQVWSTATASVPSQPSGTGGLLVVYSSIFENNGLISANGYKAKYTSISKWTGSQGKGAQYSGGSSGGGSVNIFYNKLINKGIIESNGGDSQTTNCSAYGGTGGTGTVTIGSVATGTFVQNID